MELGKLIEYLEEEDKKKNFRNFLGKKFPKGWFGYHPFHILTHPWKILEEFQLQIKWAWQRVFRGWDDRVIWSIDFYLSEQIPQWMERLKIKKHGVPNIMFKDEDYVGKNYEIPDDVFAKREEEYNEILDKIAVGFRFYNTCQNEFIEDKEEEKAMMEYFHEVSFPLFVKYFSTFWD